MKKRIITGVGMACLMAGIGLAGCAASGGATAGSAAEATTAQSSEAASDKDKDYDKDTMYQVALLQSLTQGYYDGIINVGELKQHGDTGIGTFEGVNGELIALDGVVYQALSDGNINIPADNEPVPFSNVTWFEEDGKVELSDVDSMQDLQTELNKVVSEKGKNLFYMFKIDGTFNHIKVRSEYKQEKPYIMLDEALAKDQVETDLDDISGTMVGIYCPDYMKGLNSAGWHFHFITEDHTKGGHVLAVNIKKAEAVYDITDSFEMYLPDNPDFQKMDLSKNVDEAIKNAETRTN